MTNFAAGPREAGSIWAAVRAARPARPQAACSINRIYYVMSPVRGLGRPRGRRRRAAHAPPHRCSLSPAAAARALLCQATHAQVPSVTVRVRPRLALEVARRFLSLSSLLAADLASRSAVWGETVFRAAAAAAAVAQRELVMLLHAWYTGC